MSDLCDLSVSSRAIKNLQPLIRNRERGIERVRERERQTDRQIDREERKDVNDRQKGKETLQTLKVCI